MVKRRTGGAGNVSLQPAQEMVKRRTGSGRQCEPAALRRWLRQCEPAASSQLRRWLRGGLRVAGNVSQQPAQERVKR